MLSKKRVKVYNFSKRIGREGLPIPPQGAKTCFTMHNVYMGQEDSPVDKNKA